MQARGAKITAQSAPAKSVPELLVRRIFGFVPRHHLDTFIVGFETLYQLSLWSFQKVCTVSWVVSTGAMVAAVPLLLFLHNEESTVSRQAQSDYSVTMENDLMHKLMSSVLPASE